jgi:hypothetical protein
MTATPTPRPDDGTAAIRAQTAQAWAIALHRLYPDTNPHPGEQPDESEHADVSPVGLTAVSFDPMAWLSDDEERP